jgi:hypothetical protein
MEKINPGFISSEDWTTARKMATNYLTGIDEGIRHLHFKKRPDSLERIIIGPPRPTYGAATRVEAPSCHGCTTGLHTTAIQKDENLEVAGLRQHLDCLCSQLTHVRGRAAAP